MDYNSTGAMRSPFSPRMRPSIGGRRAMGSAKKTPQSKFLQEEEVGDVIYKTPLLTVETYGAPLPVMVTEALTFAGSGSVSAKLSESGWCWVVGGRRAMAWQRDEGGAAARDLTLPQTDLAHKADLVEMWTEAGAQVPSCVGVSPEGLVRYWPSVAQEGVYVDVSCELAGQECDRLCANTSAPTTLVLATTTCTLVLLSPAEKDGRATVTCKTLRPPSGWLGGIGRRVSLLFFGSMPGHADTRLVGVVWWGVDSVALVGDGGGAGPMLQLWSPAGTTQHALRPLLAAAAAGAAPHLAHPDPTSLEVQALDLHATDNDGLLLLVAIVNVARSPEVRYAIAYISLADPAEPSVRSVTSVRAPTTTDGDPPRLVAVDSRHVIVYTSTALLYAAEGEGVVQLTSGDRVVTAACCGGRPLALLARHGVVRVRCVGTGPRAAPPPAPGAELALLGLDPRELAPRAHSAAMRLQTAFLFHLRRDTPAARALLPAPTQSEECDDVDAPLDRSVLAVAADMLDDMPAGDPRWKTRTGSSSISLGSSSALQILLQLQDKKRAFTLFLEFLRALGLWQQMQNVTFEGAVVRTRWALCALAERLAAAIALRTLQHQADHPLIDAAIYQLVQEDEEEGLESSESAGQLPPADIWYRRVTRVHRILAVLPPQDMATPTALQALAVLNHVLAEMQACRAQWAGAGAGAGAAAAWLRPLQAWLARALVAGGREQSAARAALHEAAHALADLLLQAAAVSPPSLWEDFRRDTLRPFLDAGQRERAAVLAEKYGDFELLVQMCLDDDDWGRLELYMDKYADQGFPERAFALAADRGQTAARRLVSCGSSSGRLEQWLASAGEERAALRAARLLALGDRAAAAETLVAMAQGEQQWVSRARTCAALGKLCALAAAEGGAARRGADATLALCEHQQALPASLRRRAGDKPLDAAALVALYVDAEGEDLTEYDYKKAIDLTHYITDEDERDLLRLKVWCAALNRDSWDQTASDVEAASVLHDKVFFRLADLINIMGEDVERLLPPLSEVLHGAGAGQGGPALQYWLRAAYSLLGVDV